MFISSPVRLRSAAVLTVAGFLWQGPACARRAHAPCEPTQTASAVVDAAALKAERRRFQDHPLTTAKPFGFIFNVGETPRIIWRDADDVRRMGGDARLTVRWFDANLQEAEAPNAPGRWGAYIEGTAPNGTPLRRAMTFYARPPGFLFYFLPEEFREIPLPPGPVAAAVWEEHREELARSSRELLFRAVNDSEQGAILLAGLTEAQPLGRAPRSTESAAVRNEDYHLALKLKVLGLADKVRPLAPPQVLRTPAPVLRQGTPADAGVRPDAKEKLDAICRAWAEDSGVPFVTLVARRGVIVTHEAFGRDAAGVPVALDYRCPVFSITKTVTAILFSQFIEQGLIKLDDSLAAVFPDYGAVAGRVPTFRQCLTHTSGLSGHGDRGGVRHAYLDNVVLNGLDVNEPGVRYEYSGTGFDLAAEAMELITGKSIAHLFHDHLFAPLGLGDIPMGNASADARLTAWELGVLAQWLANGGSYGELEFASPATFAQLLPEDLDTRYPGVNEIEGIGMHWMWRDHRPGAATDSTKAEDLIFSRRTIGHGSLSACILRVDLERELVVVQIRREAGPRHGEWANRFFLAVVDSLDP
jgi:CubicO group peptidase (beta-lactamase class C family)